MLMQGRERLQSVMKEKYKKAIKDVAGTYGVGRRKVTMTKIVLGENSA